MAGLTETLSFKFDLVSVNYVNSKLKQSNLSRVSCIGQHDSKIKSPQRQDFILSVLLNSEFILPRTLPDR